MDEEGRKEKGLPFINWIYIKYIQSIYQDVESCGLVVSFSTEVAVDLTARRGGWWAELGAYPRHYSL
jgi:hypothetical protein